MLRLDVFECRSVTIFDRLTFFGTCSENGTRQQNGVEPDPTIVIRANEQSHTIRVSE